VIRNSAARWIGVAVTGLLAAMLLAPSATLASTPGWSLEKSASLNPPIVKVGANAGWSVEIDNNGTSNISALYLGTDLPKTSGFYPTYVGNVTYVNYVGPAKPCNAAGSGPLLCTFGALPAGGKIMIDVIAFATHSQALDCTAGTVTYPCWSFNFEAFGNGNTPSDKGNKSHGDTLKLPVSVPTTTSGNYGGGFAINTSNVANDGLSRTNLQSENVTPPNGLIQVTVEDGLTSAPSNCVGAACSSGFGDWMRLNVGKGTVFSAPFKYVIDISGKLVPGGANVGTINFLHVLEGGTTTVVNGRCTYGTDGQPTNAPCVTVTKSSTTFQVIVWLLDNGGGRLVY